MKQKREFFFFEWTVIDNCNLNCSYCVNKGEYSQKSRDKMIYVSGRETKIAEKILQLSENADRVLVNLTGGEPLMADNFIEILSILSKAENISVQVITNLKIIDKMAEKIVPFFPDLFISGSLHASFRNDREIDKIVAFINQYKTKVGISLTQVDYQLSAEARRKLSRIKEQTGLDIEFQTFIPPWTEINKIDNKKTISDSHFASSLGKRCCLGYSHFFLLPDGAFYYDLWCNERTRKIGNLLNINPCDFSEFILENMKKCPMSSCGCNYNTFQYRHYLNACRRLGYPDKEIFKPTNITFSQRIRRKISAFRALNKKELSQRIRQKFLSFRA